MKITFKHKEFNINIEKRTSNNSIFIGIKDLGSVEFNITITNFTWELENGDYFHYTSEKQLLFFDEKEKNYILEITFI